MNHQHFEQLSSTQDYLLEQDYGAGDEILVSCEEQTAGHGQYDHSWDASVGSLCFSFTMPAHAEISLSSLEVGCLIHHYFKTSYGIELALKWPNDILSMDGLKLGGILINNQNDKKGLVVGVGLNYFNIQDQNYRTPAGNIFVEQIELDKKIEAAHIYEFIRENRMNSLDIVSYWNHQCLHLDKDVKFIDNEHEAIGKFLGIGKLGQALIEIDGNKKEFYTGSVILT